MKIIFLTTALFFVNSIFGQFGLISKSILNEIKDKDVLVELKSEDINDFADLTTEEQEKELLFNKTYNEAVQQELPVRWTLSGGKLEFRSPKELCTMSMQDLKKYILFHSGWLEKSSSTQGSFLMYSFNLEYFSSNGKRTSIFELTYVPDELIGRADLIFVSKVLKNHVAASNSFAKYSEYFNIEKNIELLGTKTLLLDKDLTQMDIEEAKGAYSSPLEIVVPEKIAEAIEKESEEFVFIKLIWSNNKNLAMYDAFDTRECNIVSCIGTGGMKVSIGAKTRKYYGPGGTSDFWDYDKYPYLDLFGGEEIFSVTVFKSKISIKKIHLKTMLSKTAQKMNCP